MPQVWLMCQMPFTPMGLSDKPDDAKYTYTLQSRIDDLDALLKHAHTGRITTFLVHPRFPVDIRHNAKIGREELAEWAARELAKRERKNRGQSTNSNTDEE